MKKMVAMLLASVMAAGTFTTTAFAYTGDDGQKNTFVSTAAQEMDAAERGELQRQNRVCAWKIPECHGFCKRQQHVQ